MHVDSIPIIFRLSTCNVSGPPTYNPCLTPISPPCYPYLIPILSISCPYLIPILSLSKPDIPPLPNPSTDPSLHLFRKLERLERQFSGPPPAFSTGPGSLPLHDSFPLWVCVVPVVGIAVCLGLAWKAMVATRAGDADSPRSRDRRGAPRAKTQRWSQFTAFKS